MTAGEVCTRRVISADPDETIPEVARRMRDLHVGDVVIADSQNRPVGLLTDRDIVIKAIAGGANTLGTLTVGKVMSHDVITVRATEPIHVALQKMQKHGIRRLPVVGTDGRLEGILTLDDILEVTSTELAQLVGLVAMEQKHERDVYPSRPPAPAASAG